MQKLGDYIREVDVRNKDLKVTNLLGLSMSKQFRTSTSNIVGVDLSKYKIVNRNVFAFDTMSVIRVHKVPIAMNDTKLPIIVSPAYITFECIDSNILDPCYLMMWFQRAEFDRYADFKSDAAVRGGYGWNELCDTPIYIPSIEQQREIVSEYETISKRIKLNEQIIKNLEATAQTLYHKMFVEGIDKENLPEGWRIGTLGEVATFKYGKLADKYPQSKEYPYPVFSGYAITGYTNEYTLEEPTIVIIARGDAGTGRICMSPQKCFLSNLAISIETKDKVIKEYLYHHLLESDTMSLRSGSAQAQITINNVEPFEITIPTREECLDFAYNVETLYKSIVLYKRENEKLTELQSLLLAKMGR